MAERSEMIMNDIRSSYSLLHFWKSCFIIFILFYFSLLLFFFNGIATFTFQNILSFPMYVYIYIYNRILSIYSTTIKHNLLTFKNMVRSYIGISKYQLYLSEHCWVLKARILPLWADTKSMENTEPSQTY